MKLLTTLLAFIGITIAASLAAPYRELVDGSCGRCDTYPSGYIGGNAQLPLRPADKIDGDFKCTTLGNEVRLSTCYNMSCALCVFYKGKDCKGDVLHFSRPGSDFGGQGSHSFFCV